MTSSQTTLTGTPPAPRPGLFALYGGPYLWFPVLTLIALGVLFVYSSSSVYAAQKYGNEFIFVRKQLFYLVPGLLAAAVGALVPLSTFDRFVKPLLAGAFLMVLATKIPGLGVKVKGASRWLALGPVQLQPSEFLKIALLLFASYSLARFPTNLPRLWPVPLCFGALLAQPDFGTTVIACLGLCAVIFLHGIPLRIFGGAALCFLPIAIGVMVAAPYRVRRLVTFLDPFADPLGAGFQVVQSFVAIANGGLLGRGLGSSQQKLFFLPEAHTDFILAVVAEEIGFVGVVAIIFIYALLYYSLSRLVVLAANHRERLLVAGALAMLAGSTLVNLGVVAGLLPTKGLPLPFISAGGSSLVANLFLMGLLSQVHRNAMNDGRLKAQ